MMFAKKYAPACERNQAHILEILKQLFTRPGRVLEIGSGTGQHAAFFAAHLPFLQWQPTDLPENIESIRAYRKEAGLSNLLEPRILDLESSKSLCSEVEYLVCINTIHIVSWPLVQSLFQLAGRSVVAGGVFYAYGPYRYGSRPLEPSNERFDQMLRARDPESGIRVFEDLDRLAENNGFEHGGDEAMPANNRSLWWIKK